LIRVATGVVLGAALGVAIGWWLWPVEPTNTPPSTLRQDYRDDYVIMVATAYEIGGDLERARGRLARLDAEEPVAPVIELAERLDGLGAEPEEIGRLARLAWELGTITPPLMPYLEGQP
jgi:hypothetical protein